SGLGYLCQGSVFWWRRWNNGSDPNPVAAHNAAPVGSNIQNGFAKPHSKPNSQCCICGWFPGRSPRLNTQFANPGGNSVCCVCCSRAFYLCKPKLQVLYPKPDYEDRNIPPSNQFSGIYKAGARLPDR